MLGSTVHLNRFVFIFSPSLFPASLLKHAFFLSPTLQAKVAAATAARLAKEREEEEKKAKEAEKLAKEAEKQAAKKSVGRKAGQDLAVCVCVCYVTDVFMCTCVLLFVGEFFLCLLTC
jgi:hypothetical protein